MIERHETVLRRLTAVPTASGLAARLALAQLERQSIDPAPLLARCGLTAAALIGRERVSVSSQIQFLELVSRATGDDWLGLTLAADFDLREWGMLYYVAASSHQLDDALKRLERYARLANEALTIRLKKSKYCCIELSYQGVPRHRDRHQIECLTFALLRLCRHLIGRNVAPVSARFVHHRSGDLGKVRRLLGCIPEFDAPADELVFEAEVFQAPVLGHDPFLNELMVRDCEEAMAERPSNVSSFRALVENTISQLLPHENAQASVVAQRLGVSERTLARRLATEDLSYGDILDQLRREKAVRYLEQPELRISKIAWLLGFRQISSFSHACRRWTGKSPLEYRHSREVEVT